MSFYCSSPISRILLFSLILLAMGSCNQTANQSATKAFPADPLERLMEGNKRFSQLTAVHPDVDIERLKLVAEGQHPFAIIVCCSDSRVSPEIIFDQGIGDLFIIRTAGNIIGNVEFGSIEYAVEHLHTKLIMVMGHENCGAVKDFVKGGNPHGHIKDIIDSLMQEIEIKAVPFSDPNRLDDCIKANIEHGVKQISNHSEIVHEKLLKKEIRVVGARYDLNDLKVEIIHP